MLWLVALIAQAFMHFLYLNNFNGSLTTGLMAGWPERQDVFVSPSCSLHKKLRKTTAGLQDQMVWSFLFLGTLDSVSYYYCCLLGQATITQVGRAKLTTVKTSTKETFAASLFNTACKRSTRKYPGLASMRRHESVVHNVTQPKTKHSHSPG